MKKLWSFEGNRTKLNGNFAAETPFGRVFRSCETTFGTRVPFCSTVPLILKLGYTCEITFEQRNDYEMISKLQNGCEIIYKLRNGLQIAKLT